MMAWTLAMGHSMVRAGLAIRGAAIEAVAPRCRARARLAGRTSGHRARRILRRPFGFHHPRHGGRQAFGLGVGPHQPAGARRRVVAGARIRFAHHVFGVDERRDHRAVRPRTGRDPGHSQRNRFGAMAVRAAATPQLAPRSLMYLGRLEYEKGIHDAIAALPRIRRTHPGTTLTVAGDGTQLGWLVEQARKHKVLKATTFVGRLDHEELVRLLHTADAAVLPSHYEPFGIVALEAAATGIPLVTSNVGGLGEAVINGQTGMSFARPRRRGPGRGRPRRARRSRRRRSNVRSPRGNGSRPTSTGTPSQAKPRRCTSPPNAANANRIRAACHRRTRTARPLIVRPASNHFAPSVRIWTRNGSASTPR